MLPCADDVSKKLRDAGPPRWFVSEAELQTISSYMRGRLTLEKVRYTGCSACGEA